MTKLLEKAVQKLAALPAKEQNRLARELLGSVEATSKEPVPPLLAKMVAKVKRNIRDGKFVEAGWDEL